jgi:hypothetical protein
MLVAKGAHLQNDGEVRRRDKLMSALGPSANFLAHAKKSLVTGLMRTRFACVVFFA